MRYNMLMDSTPQESQDFFQETPPSEVTGGIVPPEHEAVSWTASEFIQHNKDASWYFVAFVAIFLLAGTGYLVLHDFFTPGAVVVFGTLLIVVGKRKPRTLSYTIDAHGIVIGTREYDFNEFQSFSIIQEGPIESVMLLSQKRWSPAINLYFAPEDGQKIFDTLSSFLPFEQRDKDVIDKFLHKIRF